MKKNIAIFASGAGSNAKKLIEYFKGHVSVTIALIVCNKPEAGVTQIAQMEGVPLMLINKKELESDSFPETLKQNGINLIVLAGFLLKIPPTLVQAYPKQIINIHPALLPAYGGKGMYGQHVHEAVIQAKEKESGITIHYVDEQYDHGATIFQTTCPVTAADTPASLAQKIHALEHQHFAKVVEGVVLKK